MRIALLILAAALLPPLWGWGMHRMLARLWPEKPAPSDERGAEGHPSAYPIDYQI